MAIVITKKLRTILLIVLGVLVLGGGGYLLWRVNQEETVAPEDSEAATGCLLYTDKYLYVCNTGFKTITGYYKIVDITDGKCDNEDLACCLNEGHNCCMQACGDHEEEEEEVNCSDRKNSDMSQPVSDPDGEPTRCAAYTETGYTYECGAYCYLQSNGPTCCGTEGPPDYCVAEYPDYNSLPYTTTAASQKSELILYYRVIPSYTALAQFVITDPDGQDHTIKASSSQDRIETGIILEAGEKAIVKSVYETAGGKAAVGWQSVNSGNTCGSGAMGPIQNNDCERYEKKDVSSYISWANSSTDETLISRQCWADAKEWEGDYDFEDFFVQLAYLPIIVEVPTNPDWTIEKEVEGEYVVVNEENYANLDYMVTVTNIGDAEGSIDKIVDELDEKVLEDYIQSISDDGLFSSGSITWDLEGEDEVFDPNESLELTYSFQIPESAYGTYENIVTAYPTEGDNFSDSATITLAIDEEEPTTNIPQTGVLDTVIGRISLGFSFIFLGGLVSQYSKINYLFNSISDRNRFKRDIKRRQKFERKIKK